MSGTATGASARERTRSIGFTSSRRERPGPPSNRWVTAGVRRAAGSLAVAFALVSGIYALNLSAAGAQDQSTPAPAATQGGNQPAVLTAETCLACHGDPGFGVRRDDGTMRSLYIDRDKFLLSVHGKRNCVECHKQITEVPHGPIARVMVSCVQCHEQLWAQAQKEHKTQENAQLGMVVTMINRYMNSVHARPRVEDQSLTNATCYNCHDAHYVYPYGSPIRAAWRLNLPRTCGNCHKPELELYSTSVHGQEVLQKHNAGAAICSDCHTTHDIQSPERPSVRLVITQNCGGCHENELKSYLETYHGQVTTLGYAYTAKCFDCHGSHTIQRVSDPTSKVNPIHRLQTCRQCHKDATPGFATFQPHATTSDLARYPYTWIASKFMSGLLLGTLAFFWLHSALWWHREYRDSKTHRLRPHLVTAELPRSEPTVYYQRWSSIWRIAHLGFAISLIALVFTGMTLFYADSFWAPVVQRAFGGPQVTGVVHRIFAVAFVAIFLLHLVYVAFRIAPQWRTFDWFGPYSLIPNLEDMKDIYAMFRWFFGLGPRPVFDRWTYWEKFDYWAPFWGVTIIGVSGAMLWFKTLTASLLPGWVFNIATIFHGEEAFLAAAFLFTVHFFNNHWRPENFPLDIVMFTGAVPLEKFKREHTLEYDRLVRTGQLKKYIVDAPSGPMTLGSKILGFVLTGIGLILFILIMAGFVRDVWGG
jgi:cytochrome b subunit of formate dehydrogenase